MLACMLEGAIHNFVRPDETAEGRAIRIARENDPAADQNSDGLISPADFNAWILNRNLACD